MLTSRATTFLRTLKRQPAIPVRDVVAMIEDQGAPWFEPWLEFHERYAGYVEVFGRDCAVWGLVHEDAQWLAPRTVEVDSELGGKVWYVTCADVHPSYTYQLDNNGEFLGGPARNFDTHVERLALFAQFRRLHNVRRRTGGEVLAPQARQRLALVVEASDSFFRYYSSDEALLVEHTATGKIRDCLVGSG